jgi:heme oxygenase
VPALNVAVSVSGTSLALSRLRAATDELHRHIEAQLDIVERLADPARRAGMIRRFAVLHGPAAAALDPWLADVPGLPAGTHPLVAEGVETEPMPRFPAPGSRAEALGMRYVLEGSALGGRLILRRLAERGIRDSRLAFLAPYDADTGARWRSLLAVLERELAHESQIADACRGALRAFRHAGRMLAEDRP